MSDTGEVEYTEDSEPLVPEGPPPEPTYGIVLGYTHGDGYLVRTALGQAPGTRVAQLCRRVV